MDFSTNSNSTLPDDATTNAAPAKPSLRTPALGLLAVADDLTNIGSGIIGTTASSFARATELVMEDFTDDSIPASSVLPIQTYQPPAAESTLTWAPSEPSSGGRTYTEPSDTMSSRNFPHHDRFALGGIDVLTGIGERGRYSLHASLPERLEFISELPEPGSSVLSDAGESSSTSTNDASQNNLLQLNQTRVHEPISYPFPWHYEFSWVNSTLVFAGDPLLDHDLARRALSQTSRFVGPASSRTFTSKCDASSVGRPDLEQCAQEPTLVYLARVDRIDKLVYIAIDDFIRCYMPRQHGKRRNESTHRSANDKVDQTTSSKTSRVSHTQPRRQKRCKTTGGNEDSGDEDNHRDGTSGGSKSGTSKSKALIACPYLRWDPIQFSGCAKRTFRKMAIVKRHLRDDHYQQYCPKCFVTILEDHACIPKPEPDGFFTTEKLAKLKQYADRTREPKEQWKDYYEILFPGHPVNFKPYLTDSVYGSRFVSDLQQHAEEYLSGPIKVFLRESIESTGSSANDLRDFQRVCEIFTQKLLGVLPPFGSPADRVCAEQLRNYEERINEAGPSTLTIAEPDSNQHSFNFEEINTVHSLFGFAEPVNPRMYGQVCVGEQEEAQDTDIWQSLNCHGSADPGSTSMGSIDFALDDGIGGGTDGCLSPSSFEREFLQFETEEGVAEQIKG